MDYPDIVTRVLQSGQGREKRWSGATWEGLHPLLLALKTERGQHKEYGRPLEAETGRTTGSPAEPSDRKAALLIP